MNYVVNYLVLADAANIDNFGKVNILGIFSKIFAEKVPTAYGKFSIVGNISFSKLDGKALSLEVKILDPDNKEIAMNKPIKIELLLPESKEKKGDLNMLLDIVNLKLNALGEYNIVIHLDDTEIVRKSFQVEQKKTEVKQ